jgi:RNA polymerase sigma-70 factor (ECF subfamily)
MQPADSNRPLDGISTLWSVVSRAHGGATEEVSAAQQELLMRYGGAIHRYLLGALRDPDAADELAQEFALRFVRGDFRNVDPAHGRFRDFIKAVLIHLIADHHRRLARSGRTTEGLPEPAAPDETLAELDRRFLEGWRQELLRRTWEALEQVERQTGQMGYTVLRLKAARQELSSAEMAEHLSAQLCRPVTDAWVRQNLHRGRVKFADLLVREVIDTLDEPTVLPCGPGPLSAQSLRP